MLFAPVFVRVRIHVRVLCVYFLFLHYSQRARPTVVDNVFVLDLEVPPHHDPIRAPAPLRMIAIGLPASQDAIPESANMIGIKIAEVLIAGIAEIAETVLTIESDLVEPIVVTITEVNL